MATKVEMKEQIAHARHELRTPVNAIIGYSELLIEDAEDLADERDLLQVLEEIHAQGQQLNAAITRVLGEEATAHLQPEQLPSLETSIRDTLGPLCQGVLDRCTVLLEKMDRPDLKPFQDDLQRITTAANNLLEQLNDPFQKQESGVRSQESGVKPSPPLGGGSLSSAHLPTSPSGGHVLIVDDNAFNRDMLARLLQRQNHSYAMADNGKQALDMLAAEKFDVVLLDIMMPEMDGFEVLRRLKSNHDLHHIPVIMISALDEINSVVRCIEMGAEDFLPKPFDPVLLRARVGACLEQKRLRDQELDYLKQVARVTEAAAALESGTFAPESLRGVAERSDALGKLAHVFIDMAREVKAREERLQKQVQQLKVEIDETRKKEQVAEITETGYFQMLKEKAQALKRKKK